MSESALETEPRSNRVHRLMADTVLAELVVAYPGGWSALNARMIQRLDAMASTAQGTELRAAIENEWANIGVLGHR